MTEEKKQLHAELKRYLDNSDDYDRIKNQIADCLTNGTFADLKFLQAEKAEFEQRSYFRVVQQLKSEITALEAERIACREAVEVLENQKKQISIDENILALQLEQVRESHAEKNAEIYIQRLADDSVRQGIFEKQNILESLVKSQMEKINL